MEAGINSPPFHPYCRCTTCPYFDDMEGYRASRNDEGKTVYEVPANMIYEEWKKAFTKDLLSDEIKSLYFKFKNILGNMMPTVEDFIKIKYNDSKDWELFKAYCTSIEVGELTPLSDFELYRTISRQIDENLIGAVTPNGIKISNKSKHFIARVIGSVEQRRSGVLIQDIVQALKEPNKITPVKKLKNGSSQKFILWRRIAVTINPDTGTLVQTNPL